jgi:O-antigen/teichoic acid export membrane protein
MSLTGQVGRNTIVQVTGKVLGTILGLIVIALLTRYLGTEGYGQYTTVIAYLLDGHPGNFQRWGESGKNRRQYI